MGKFSKLIHLIAQDQSIDPEKKAKAIEGLLNRQSEQDGGPGSGNFGHKGRPGKRGGSGKGEGSGSSEGGSGNSETSTATTPATPPNIKSMANKPENKARLQKFLEKTASFGGRGNWGGFGAKSGTGGKVTGNMGASRSGEKFNGRDYSLNARGLQTRDGKGSWEAKGKASKTFPKGSGTTRISEGDVKFGCHTINKYLTADGQLTPERAAKHEETIQKLFEGKTSKPEGQRTFYFLGGGSASGKGSFTRPGKADRYGMPDKNACTVVDADELKQSIYEYNYDEEKKTGTGTTNREKAASFAHEESSALAKRAMEAAFANGYDCTLDGTGDGSVEGVMKKINQARKAGYKVEARYCTASIENALQRNLERAQKTGRKVQEDSVIGIHKSVSEIFPQVAPEFDHVTLWDHDGDEPVLVAECFRGQLLQIKNQKLYDKFIAKAKWERPTK